MTRRKALQQAAAWAAIGATTTALSSQAQGESQNTNTQAIPIVDTHQHLWDLTRFKLPWLQNAPRIAQSYVMKDYLAATAGLNVVKSVYMEVDVTPEQQQQEADFVIETCRGRNSPMVAGVISGRPASPGFGAYIRPFTGSPYIKGVRQVLHGSGTPKGYCLQPDFIKGIRLLGELGMSYDICIRSTELSDGIKLVDACPDNRFILDHCGNGSVGNPNRKQWEDDIAAFATRKNVTCKVSGIIATVKPEGNKAEQLQPIVLHVLKCFGPDRVMFGGDWPVCTLGGTFREWVEALRWIVRDRPVAEQRKLFHDNAMRFYGLAG